MYYSPEHFAKQCFQPEIERLGCKGLWFCSEIEDGSKNLVAVSLTWIPSIADSHSNTQGTSRHLGSASQSQGQQIRA